MDYFLGIDIGGTNIKAALIDSNKIKSITDSSEAFSTISIQSGLSLVSDVNDFINVLDTLLTKLESNDKKIAGIGISTAGIVNYQGTRLELCAPHLQALKSEKWIDFLKEKTGAPVVLINDADAATIGASAYGYIKGNKIYGVMPIGTGIGFTVIRNCRRWTPNFSLTLLGSVFSPISGSYDALCSASLLAKQSNDGDLKTIFRDEKYSNVKNEYYKNLCGIITSAYLIYGINDILIGGGLADAIISSGYSDNFINEIRTILKANSALGSDSVCIRLLTEGNRLPLIGALLLAHGEAMAQSRRVVPNFSSIKTEKPYNASLRLDKMDTRSIIENLYMAECESNERFHKSLPNIAEVVDVLTDKLNKGGRLIYVGCGTSGRLAAVDTVEIACTFGFPRDKVLTLISGGVADASIDIETKFEEDASAVPEMLMANVSKDDVVIGISVSGSAYYVQSALGYSKSIGATAVMIQQEMAENLKFCDYVLPLYSGSELIAGSTRMKAGTATKKITNFITTSAMIKLGKVHGSYMTELECINDKLIKRATSILFSLYELNKDEALILLQSCNFRLNEAIRLLESKDCVKSTM